MSPFKPSFRSQHLEDCLNERMFPKLLFWIYMNVFCVSMRRLNSAGWTPEFAQHYVHWDTLKFTSGVLNRKPGSGKKYYCKSRHRYKVALRRLEELGELERVPEMDQDGELIAYRFLTGDRKLSCSSFESSPSVSISEVNSIVSKQAPKFLCLLIPLQNDDKDNSNVIPNNFLSSEMGKIDLLDSVGGTEPAMNAQSNINESIIEDATNSKEQNSDAAIISKGYAPVGHFVTPLFGDSSSQVLHTTSLINNLQEPFLLRHPNASLLSCEPCSKGSEINLNGQPEVNLGTDLSALQLSIEPTENDMEMSENFQLLSNEGKQFSSPECFNSNQDEEILTGIKQFRKEYKKQVALQHNLFEKHITCTYKNVKCLDDSFDNVEAFMFLNTGQTSILKNIIKDPMISGFEKEDLLAEAPFQSDQLNPITQSVNGSSENIMNTPNQIDDLLVHGWEGIHCISLPCSQLSTESRSEFLGNV